MKRGGRVIYGGKLGVQSQIMTDYFQVRLESSSVLLFLVLLFVQLLIFHIE